MIIRVPATSANVGPGFDSLGLAVNLYLYVEICEPAVEWHIEHNFPYLPNDSRNLIIKTALSVNKKLPPHRLKMTSDIPTTRGLGSSASAIVAGVELADYLGQMHLSIREKIKIATRLEGQSDNIVPAFVGGFTCSVMLDERVFWTKLKLLQVKCIACVPSLPLSTKKSREVLPHEISLNRAAKGSAISNVLLSQIALGNLNYIKTFIEQDVFHEPYRKKLVPELDAIRELLRYEKTYGTYLSGAGFTVMTIVPYQQSYRISEILKERFPNHTIYDLHLDTMGTKLIDE